MAKLERQYSKWEVMGSSPTVCKNWFGMFLLVHFGFNKIL